MQNKPNFRKSQVNVSIFSKMAYENKHNRILSQNKPNQTRFKPNLSQLKPISMPIKPNSNPNKPNFKKAQMNVSLTLTKDYRKKDDFVVPKNKPNQTQSCPP